MIVLGAPKHKRPLTQNISRRGIRNGRLFYDNTVDAFNVTLWAQTSLAILFENMVMANLVYRDFESQVAAYGDTVNTRKPGEFTAKRKTNADNVTVQNATATNIPVKLNQHWHVSYLIKDGEETISFKSLIDEFLRPAMIAESRAIDRVLSSQVYQFLPNNAGRLGAMDSTNAKQNVLDTRQVMNLNKAWLVNRNLVLSPFSETVLLEVEQFTDANRVGDDGTALREASLGRKLGFDILMAQNQPHITVPATGTGGGNVAIGAINNASNYPAGTTTFTVDGLSAAIAVGTWLTIAGDDTPLQVVSTVGGATPTSITVNTPTKRAVVDDAVITIVVPGSVNASGGYAVGYDKEITITSTVAPQIGQLVSFGLSTTAPIYAIVDATSNTGITLDRPLEEPSGIANSAAVNFGPPGSYNFAFHPNAVAMVSRPLALPRPGTGALAGTAEWQDMSIRVVITYDGNKQGHLVTIDMLMGVQQLEPLLGAVMFG